MNRKQHWSEREYEATRTDLPPLCEPATPTKGTPCRTDAQRLDAYKTNLDWAIDCASLKLNRLKPGSSAYKTQAGYLRGLVDARESLISEMGASL